METRKGDSNRSLNEFEGRVCEVCGSDKFISSVHSTSVPMSVLYCGICANMNADPAGLVEASMGMENPTLEDRKALRADLCFFDKRTDRYKNTRTLETIPIIIQDTSGCVFVLHCKSNAVAMIEKIYKDMIAKEK